MASKWGAKLRPLLSSAMEGKAGTPPAPPDGFSPPPPLRLRCPLPTQSSLLSSLRRPLLAGSPISAAMIQKRDASSKERKRTRGTPVTSKLKKIKMKSYSSYKFRFRTMNDGEIRRWREGSGTMRISSQRNQRDDLDNRLSFM